jgi:Ni,Fe-hydrogenase maturation factor
MIILGFGNPDMPDDSLALHLIDDLREQGIECAACTSSDDFLRYADEEDELLIIDTAVGIQEPMLLDDISGLTDKPRFSLHDLDLQFFIRLLEGLGKLPKLHIIALPIGMERSAALAGTRRLLSHVIDLEDEV